MIFGNNLFDKDCVIYKQQYAFQDLFLILLIAVSSFGESLRWELPHRPGGGLLFKP